MYRIYKGDNCAAGFTDEFGIVFYRSEVSLTCVLLNAEDETISVARAYDDGRKSEYSFTAQNGSGKLMRSKRGEMLAAHNDGFVSPDEDEDYVFTTHSGEYSAVLIESGDEPVIGYIKGDRYSVRTELVTDKYSLGFEFAGAVIKAANAFECRFEDENSDGCFMDMEGFTFDEAVFG